MGDVDVDGQHPPLAATPCEFQTAKTPSENTGVVAFAPCCLRREEHPGPARALRNPRNNRSKIWRSSTRVAAQLYTTIPSSSPFNSSCTLICTFLQPKELYSRQRCVLFSSCFLRFVHSSLPTHPSPGWAELVSRWSLLGYSPSAVGARSPRTMCSLLEER